MEKNYDDYVKSVCIETLLDYGYEEDDFDFYDMIEHDLYIWNKVDDQVIIVEEFY